MVVEHIMQYLDESIACLSQMKSMAQEIEMIAHLLIEARNRGANIFIIGNGGSGSTASHMSCDLNKTSIVSGISRFRAISLVDNMPIILAWSNDVAYEDIFKEQLENLWRSGDVVIAISGSGNSENIIRAVKFAKAKGIKVIGLTGFNGGKLKDYSDECLIVPSNSMYRIEDMHLMINHILTTLFLQHRDH